MTAPANEGRHVADEQLTAEERRALLALMVAAREVTNKELKAIAGIELTGKPRVRLNTLKLVESPKVGRGFRHLLTDAGAKRCAVELVSPRPAKAGPDERLLHSVLASVHRYMERSKSVLSEIFKPDIELMIRHAYDQLAERPVAPVRLSALYAKLDEVAREDIEAELTRMVDIPGVFLRAAVDQQTLTDDDREAALRLGGQDRHNLQIEER